MNLILVVIGDNKTNSLKHRKQYIRSQIIQVECIREELGGRLKSAY